MPTSNHDLESFTYSVSHDFARLRHVTVCNLLEGATAREWRNGRLDARAVRRDSPRTWAG